MVDINSGNDESNVAKPKNGVSINSHSSVPSNATLEHHHSSSSSNVVVAAHLVLDDRGKQLLRIPIHPSVSMTTTTTTNDNSTEKPSCLIVGRQAATVDIRIDHKSISRQHALLFYCTSTTGNDTGETDLMSSSSDNVFIMHVGGKHGTSVNDTKIVPEKSTLLKEGDRIQFGNCTERIFHLRWLPIQSDESGTSMTTSIIDGPQVIVQALSGSTPLRPDHFSLEEEINKGRQDGEATTTEKKDPLEGLTGRARREAEIAAMMATLDEAPTYTPHPTTVAESLGDENIMSSSTTKELDQILQEYKLPISHGINFEQVHNKTITTFAMDISGARLLTGSNDYTIQMYDFGGMDSQHKPYGELQMSSTEDDLGQYPIVELCYSCTGDKFVVATTSSAPRIFDREGSEIVQFAKGDMYVTDMSRTKGHVSSVTGAQWHPLEREILMTSSQDGSVRLWNLRRGKLSFDKKLTCSSVYKIKTQGGLRTPVTSLAYHPSGREFVVGTSCGSIQIWNATTVRLRPERAVYEAHGPLVDSTANDKNENNDKRSSSSAPPVTFVTFSPDGKIIASRAGGSNEVDDTVRIWPNDNTIGKSNSQPLFVCPNVPSFSERSNCAFSSPGRIICIGTYNNKNNAGAKDGILRLFRIPKVEDSKKSVPSTLVPIVQLPVFNKANLIRVFWHPKLNQILCGGSDGSIRMLYDPKLSKKGVLLSTSRMVRTKQALELLLEKRAKENPLLPSNIMEPNALPMYRDPALPTRMSKRRREELEEQQQHEQRKPQPPDTAKHLIGGRSSASVNFTQFVVQNTIQNKNIAGKDPREDLFQYKEGKNYVDQAYAGDVSRVFADKTVEQEQEELEEGKHKKSK